MKLVEHNVTLRGERVVLRPMTENDWDILLAWNQDPEVLHFSEGGDVSSYSLDDIQEIYRGTSQAAFCFIIEIKGEPIGECWLQRMNIERILKQYPDEDCRRIDLMIGGKDLWGQGYGTDTIQTLTRFGFERERADRILGWEIADYNIRSLRAFQKAGYSTCAKIEHPPGGKARYGQDVVMTREQYMQMHARRRETSS